MSISEELRRARDAVILPDDVKRAVELRRELERQGMVKPPEMKIVRQEPAQIDKHIRVFYR